MKKSGILFLTLRTFSATGGIEKVCRVAGKALFEITQQLHLDFRVFSMHDETLHADRRYFPIQVFKGFKSKKIRFANACIINGIKSRIVILSHINLLLFGYLIKIFSPNTKLVLIAHGIEVWYPMPGWRRKMLIKVDLIIAVSRFTKEKMKKLHQLEEDKFAVLNNSLDPFLPRISSGEETAALRSKYGFGKDDFIMFTLSRLSGKEKNKGYDKILFAQAGLIKQYPHFKYLFAGKYDEAEKSRLDKLIENYGLRGSVNFTGFVPDDELAAHYGLADVYVMPSEKEGFGISFIEAIYYGVPVIAGNRDGTSDALCNGELGTLIDPRNQQEITNAIQKVIENKRAFIPDRELMISKFGYEGYRSKFHKILEPLFALN